MKPLGGGVGCCLVVLGGVGLGLGYGGFALTVLLAGAALVLVSML